MAVRGLGKPSRAVGGCCRGGPQVAGVAAGLGLDLGRAAMSCTNPAYIPRVAAVGSNPPHLHERRGGRRSGPGPPRKLRPPQSQRLPAHGDESPVAMPPPLFHVGGEGVELGQLNHLHPLFRGGGGLPPFPPGQLRLRPPPPSKPPPPRRGLSRWTTPLHPPIPTSPAPKSFDASAASKPGESKPDSPGG